MRRNSIPLIFLALLLMTTGRAQQSLFTVASIKPFDKAVPGQIMEVLIEGLTPGAEPVILPETDFKIDVLQDGVSQKAKVRLTKFTMIPQMNSDPSTNTTTSPASKCAPTSR